MRIDLPKKFLVSGIRLLWIDRKPEGFTGLTGWCQTVRQIMDQAHEKAANLWFTRVTGNQVTGVSAIGLLEDCKDRPVQGTGKKWRLVNLVP